MYDVLIIGAGITGASIAMELSKYRLKIAWLEKNNDVAMETSKANSGIIHSGYDPKPGTNMAKLNALGAKLYKKLAPELKIHYQQIGSLVIGRNEQDLEVIRELYKRGMTNGVENLEILSGHALRNIEPNLREDVQYALYSPTAAIISPWEACLAFAQTAVQNGVSLYLNARVNSIVRNSAFYSVRTEDMHFETRYIINCAGVYADDVFHMINHSGEEDFLIEPVKGSYYLLDKSQGSIINHVVFQTPGPHGKGVLVSPTVHGNLIVGPDAVSDVHDKEDCTVPADSLRYVQTSSETTTDKINFCDNVRNFAGLRSKIRGKHDFLIEESKANPGFINFAGIQSPGLSCGPAFGIRAVELLREAGCRLEEKADFTYVPLKPYIKDLTIDEINDCIRDNPLYGRIICRCEQISEGEILDAIHQPIGATTIDGVKRRTNAGMGRCQGGFCGPRVLEILRRELGCAAKDIYQDSPGSYIVAEERGSEL